MGRPPTCTDPSAEDNDEEPTDDEGVVDDEDSEDVVIVDNRGPEDADLRLDSWSAT
jgi:hypothetical protein